MRRQVERAQLRRAGKAGVGPESAGSNGGLDGFATRSGWGGKALPVKAKLNRS